MLIMKEPWDASLKKKRHHTGHGDHGDNDGKDNGTAETVRETAHDPLRRQATKDRDGHDPGQLMVVHADVGANDGQQRIKRPDG